MSTVRKFSRLAKRHIGGACSIICLTILCSGDVTGCEPGWQAFGEYCYILLVRDLYYNSVLEARRECMKLGTDLASVRNEAEQRFVETLFPGTNVTEVYFALSDAMDEGHFVYYDGTEPSYTNWGVNEPNNYALFKGEHCAAMIYTDTTRNVGDWIDVPCLFNPRFINGAICKKLATEQPEDNSPGWFHDKFRMVKDSYMMNNTILSTNVPTYADCVRLCSQDIMCLSVNYNRYGITDHNCVLNRQSRLMSRNLTSDSTLAGFDVQDWVYYEQTYKGY